jgi:hypothetical protein
MSLFRVEWEEEGENELANIWTVAPDRAAVSRAALEADRILERDPVAIGTELSEGLYRIVIEPLIIHYEIDNQQKLVKVTRVARLP